MRIQFNDIHLGVIKVNGPQQFDFLQGQVTCDLTQLSTTQALPGTLCDIKGKVEANFIIYTHQEAHFLILAKPMIPHIIKRLKKYGIFSKVSIHETDLQVLGHTSSITAVQPTYQLDLTETPSITLPDKKQHTQLLINPNNISADTQQSLDAEWQQLKVELGLVDILPITSGQFTPQMLNLHHHQGVSFKKGCYLGQEIVARTQHLGKLKRHLYQLNVPQQHAVGSTITLENNTQVGVIVTSAITPDGNTQALAVIEDRALTQLLLVNKHALSEPPAKL